VWGGHSFPPLLTFVLDRSVVTKTLNQVQEQTNFKSGGQESLPHNNLAAEALYIWRRRGWNRIERAEPFASAGDNGARHASFEIASLSLRLIHAVAA
jgi:hypothetical protein